MYKAAMPPTFCKVFISVTLLFPVVRSTFIIAPCPRQPDYPQHGNDLQQDENNITIAFPISTAKNVEQRQYAGSYIQPAVDITTEPTRYKDHRNRNRLK